MISSLFSRLSFRVSLLIAVLSGLSLVTAFEPFNFFWMAIVAPALLVLVWQNKSTREAFYIGYGFGLGLFSGGVYWVYNSVHEFGHAPASFAIGLTVVFVLYLSLFPAAVGWIQAKLRAQENVYVSFLVLPSIWVLIELLRGWLLTGFPWLQLGYSQTDSALASFAPMLGVLGVSWVVMLLAVAVSALFAQRMLAKMIGVAVMVVIGTFAYFAHKYTWGEPIGEPLSVSMIQGNISQDDKWADEWLIPTIDRYRDLTRENWDSDLIIWPEAALPGLYSTFEEAVLTPLAEEARSNNTDLITGVLYENEGAIYNSVITLGKTFGVYHKRHLVPFGEYIPFRNITGLFEGLVVLPADDITAASEATLLEAAGVKIAASVCYEDAYGEEMSELLPAANVLVNVSNDAWFGDSLAPPQHLQMAQMRAIEFERPLLRATNTGMTASVNEKGKVIASIPQFELAVLKTTVQPRTGSTPYAKWGNWGIIGLLGMVFLLGWGMSRREFTSD